MISCRHRISSRLPPRRVSKSAHWYPKFWTKDPNIRTMVSSVWSVHRATPSVDLHVEWLLRQDEFKPDAMRTTGNLDAYLLAKQEEVLLRCLDAYTVNETVLVVTKRPFFHSAQDKAADGKHQRKRFAGQSADVDELHGVEDDYDEVELEAIQQAVATPGRTFVYPADAPSRPCPTILRSPEGRCSFVKCTYDHNIKRINSFCMELIAIRTLSTISKLRRLSWPDTRSIARSICVAVVTRDMDTLSRADLVRPRYYSAHLDLHPARASLSSRLLSQPIDYLTLL